ncbi:MAG: HzsA-related protein [Planctomycetota bacterium]
MKRRSRLLLSVVACAVATCRPGASAETNSAGRQELEADWLFQADNKPTFGRIREEIGWARELAARISMHGYEGYPAPQVLEPRSRAPDLAKELAELKEIEAGLEGQKESRDVAREKYLAVRRVKRRIAFKNPVVDFDKVLLIDNPKPAGGEPDHEARHRNGFMARNGGRLLVLDGLDPGSPVRDLVGGERPGSFWRPDASFDGRKVVFSMKPHDELAFHLYEVNVDGTGLRQLTRGDYDDLDPIYLPDGHIMFITSRCNTYIRCMPYTYSFVLARCEADGRNIYIISCNSEPDYLPSLMNDGRVIYSRWEYTDKALWRVQSLWTTNPDGTNVAAFWGNQSVWPDHVTEARAIPGSRRIMFTGLGHHRWFEGSVGIIDPAPGLNFPWGLTKVTADVAWPEVGNGPVDPKETDRYHRAGRYNAYKSPYPVSQEDFLVSARAGRGNFKLYLMDVYGNRELIFQGKHNAWHAMPLKSRPRPPIIPDRVAWPGTGADHTPPKPGVLFTSSVFDGASEIPKDRVKYLRVIEMDAKTYSTWHKTVQHDGPAVGIFQAEAVKRILGTVPIEADGSVQFELVPGKAVYFQLIDKDFRCIQSMRSFSGVMPGERRGCVGCHEQRNTRAEEHHVRQPGGRRRTSHRHAEARREAHASAVGLGVHRLRAVRPAGAREVLRGVPHGRGQGAQEARLHAAAVARALPGEPEPPPWGSVALQGAVHNLSRRPARVGPVAREEQGRRAALYFGLFHRGGLRPARSQLAEDARADDDLLAQEQAHRERDEREAQQGQGGSREPAAAHRVGRLERALPWRGGDPQDVRPAFRRGRAAPGAPALCHGAEHRPVQHPAGRRFARDHDGAKDRAGRARQADGREGRRPAAPGPREDAHRRPGRQGLLRRRPEGKGCHAGPTEDTRPQGGPPRRLQLPLRRPRAGHRQAPHDHLRLRRQAEDGQLRRGHAADDKGGEGEVAARRLLLGRRVRITES